jgi:hypothetical protein
MGQPGHRGLLAGLALLVTAAAIAVGLVAAKSDPHIERVAAHRDTGRQVSHHPLRAPGQKRCRKEDPEGHTNPARISGENAAFTTSSILLPVNVWTAGDCHRVTQIEAGAAGWHASAGIFVITRIRGSSSARPRYIVVPDSGAVRITDAPVGPEVITSAQERGELAFESKRGITGSVNVGDNTVTLSDGTVIQATDKPFSGAG